MSSFIRVSLVVRVWGRLYWEFQVQILLKKKKCPEDKFDIKSSKFKTIKIIKTGQSSRQLVLIWIWWRISQPQRKNWWKNLLTMGITNKHYKTEICVCSKASKIQWTTPASQRCLVPVIWIKLHQNWILKNPMVGNTRKSFRFQLIFRYF